MLEFGQLLAETVTGSATNEAHPHGMANIPDIVVLTSPSHADITVGTTVPDATNIYLTNANVADQDCNVLMMAL